MRNDIGRPISVPSLIHLRKCKHTLPFFDLGLAYKKSAQHDFFQGMKVRLGELLLSGCPKESVATQMQSFFDSGYLESFFDLRVQYEVSKEVDWLKLMRFLTFYFDNGYKTIAFDRPYQVPIKLEYQGVGISEVTGKADLILQGRDGSVVAVMLKSGAPNYSYQARHLENRVCHALELQCMFLGLETLYPELSTAVFYLKNKDDKNGALVPNFEKGKNFVQWQYQSREEAMRHFALSLDFKPKGDCRGCSVAGLCHLAPFQGNVPELKNQVPPVKEKPAFTAAQEQVVHHVDGPMNVIAVPGSGKTFSLVQRLLYLLKEKRISPDRILFVTFTKKAAGEIRERVTAALTGEGIKAPDIFTFNGLGHGILRNFPDQLGGRRRIADKVSRHRLIESCLDAVPRINRVSYGGITGEYGLLNMLDAAIAFIDTHGIDIYRASYAQQRDVDGIFRLYQAYKAAYRDAGYITYDDQIALANKLFAADKNILKAYQEHYQYVMVDEFQDVSEPQKNLIYAIAAHGNLVVVGDDDQTIYRWRGGTNAYMLNFVKDWPNARSILMEDNFRSADTILEASNALIGNNGIRFMKKTLAHQNGKNRPVYWRNFTPQDIWKVVSSALENGHCPGDIAIIARNNKELADVQGALSPYVKTASPRAPIIEDAVFIQIKDVVSLYYNAMQDNQALYRFLKYQGCDFNGRFHSGSLYDSLVAAQSLLPIDLFNVDCLPTYESKKNQNGFMQAGHLLVAACKAIQYATDPANALREVFRLLFREEAHPVLDGLMAKVESHGLATVRDLSDHLERMERYKDTTEIEYPVRKTAVNLLTAHKSKGKEYPVVIVYGTEFFDDSEEGRCLLYVAMTRAKRTLYLTQGQYGKAPLFDEIEGYVDLHTKQAS